MRVSDVSDDNIIPVRAFLEKNSDTSLLLLSNLSSYGYRLGSSLNSGNFKCLLSDDEILAVFCLTRRGNLLAETGGQTNFAWNILDACADEPVKISGVIGEWNSSEAIWKLLLQSKKFTEIYRSKEILYRLDLSPAHTLKTPVRSVRRLTPHDFDQWEPLNTAFLEGEGIPVYGTAGQRQADFEESALAGRWWGYMEYGKLLAVVALNALYKQTGQVGGVYTVPGRRRRGLGRITMRAMIDNCMRLYHLEKLVLFTGENNHAAQGLYESLGFTVIGEYALLFGSYGTDRY